MYTYEFLIPGGCKDRILERPKRNPGEADPRTFELGYFRLFVDGIMRKSTKIMCRVSGETDHM